MTLDLDSSILLSLLKSAIDAPKPKPEKEKADEANSINIPFAKLKEGENIQLSPMVIEKLALIAADYRAATGNSITITDGIRNATEQAFLMIPQIEKGKIHLYVQKQPQRK